MKRALIAFCAALPLTIGVAAAHDWPGAPGGGEGPGGVPETPHAVVVGKVVSVDKTAGTIVADASVAPVDENEGGGHHHGFGGGGWGGGWGGPGAGGPGGGGRHFDTTPGGVPTTPTPPPTTRVTITTNSSTKIKLDGETATVGDLPAGAKFIALFNGKPTDTIETLVANPALAVFAHTPRQLYAFVGTVTAVDTTAGTVTVNVSRSLPSSLVPAGSPPVAFKVGPETLILGGSGNSLFGGTLSNVAVGDIVAGGEIGKAGLTLAQVQATPLMVLLDLPASSMTSTTTPTTPAAAKARARALRSALALLGGNSSGKSHGHKKPKKHGGHHSHASKR